MKIAICSTFLGQKTSGGEVSAFHLARNLSEKEDVFVVTTKVSRKLSMRSYAMPFLKFIPNIALLIGSPLFDAYMTSRMKTIFKNERPDVVHVQDASILIPSLRAAASIKAPVVMTVRDYRFTCNLSTCLEDNRIEYHCDRKTYRSCLRKSLRSVYGKGWLEPFLFPFFYSQRNRLVEAFQKVTRYIAVSDFIREEVIKSGISPAKIKTILVQKEDWASAGKGKYIFTAGGLKGTKGFGFLISAFELVTRKLPKLKLRIAGDGSARQKLEKKVLELGLQDNIIFLGNLRRAKMKKEYANSLFVISPSTWPEPLSRIIFEAFSSGKTVIATDVGGSKELVMGFNTGILVRPMDKKMLAEAILKLVEDDGLRKKLETGATKLIDKCCTADVNYKAHMAIYREVVH